MNRLAPRQEAVEQPLEASELATAYVDVAQRASRLLAHYMKKRGTDQAAVVDQFASAKAFMDLSAHLLASPYRLAQTQMDVVRDHLLLWQQTMLQAMGMPAEPVAAPEDDDPRFRDRAWVQSFLFDFIKQSYLVTARHVHSAVARTRGLDRATERRVTDLTEQAINALAPTNFALTNPEVLRETVYSRGRNLVNGLKRLLKDLEAGGGRLPLLSGAAGTALRLGEEIAATPGKVIFENELLQLIQYDPLTVEQYRTPLLVVPSWRHRYYVFDLRQNTSFVRWALDQGLTTFVISWADADESLVDKGFDDYLIEGTLAALQAVERATGEKLVHVAGHCLGGTLLAATLAYLAVRRNKRAATATFLGTLFDFAQADETIACYGEETEGGGSGAGLQGEAAGRLLRSNDLIWAYVVHNYLLGKDSLAGDLLCWDEDATRASGKVDRFVVDEIVLGNRLATPGSLRLAGATIDLARIRTPSYFLGAVEDHIAPWRASYAGARLLHAPVRYVLAGSGHVAGIINPPSANRHAYCTNEALPERAESFLASAIRHDGSWWGDWLNWLLQQPGSKQRVPARVPGSGDATVIENAPGRYAGGRATPAERDRIGK